VKREINNWMTICVDQKTASTFGFNSASKWRWLVLRFARFLCGSFWRHLMTVQSDWTVTVSRVWIWILKESGAACVKVLELLRRHMSSVEARSSSYSLLQIRLLQTQTSALNYHRFAHSFKRRCSKNQLNWDGAHKKCLLLGGGGLTLRLCNLCWIFKTMSLYS
jgi:hypothetical protein